MADFQPVQARQHPIQYHQIRRSLSRHDQPFGAVRCSLDGVAFIGQATPQELQDSCIVFDNQDVFSHRGYTTAVYEIGGEPLEELSTQDLAGLRSEMAYERTVMASIRTYLALLRTGLAIAGGGALVASILGRGSWSLPSRQFSSSSDSGS